MSMVLGLNGAVIHNIIQCGLKVKKKSGSVIFHRVKVGHPMNLSDEHILKDRLISFNFFLLLWYIDHYYE